MKRLNSKAINPTTTAVIDNTLLSLLQPPVRLKYSMNGRAHTQTHRHTHCCKAGAKFHNVCGCKKCKKKVKAKRSKTRQSREIHTHTQTTTRKTVAVVNFIYKAVDVNDSVDAASCAAFNEFLCMRRETKINEKLQPKKVSERERERGAVQ